MDLQKVIGKAYITFSKGGLNFKGKLEERTITLKHTTFFSSRWLECLSSAALRELSVGASDEYGVREGLGVDFSILGTYTK